MCLYSSFQGTYLVDIVSIESKLGKLAFSPVTSQNDSGRCITKTRHDIETAIRGQIFSIFFLPIFREDTIFLGKSTL